MSLVFHLLAVFLAVLQVTGSPAHLSKKSLTINQIIKPRLVSEDLVAHQGIAAYAKALGKFGASADTVSHLSALALKHGNLGRTRQAEVHQPNIARGVSPASSQATGTPPNPYPQVAGPLSASPAPFDAFYTTEITIGDQQFPMDFDTGSSDLWVFGPNVTGLAPNQTHWHESATSHELDGYSFYIAYGDGSYASGGVWTDHITLGSVVVPNASVEVANFAGGSFQAPISGIVGLGFDVNNEVTPVQSKTIFTELISRNLISRPVLATDLHYKAPGSYTFGDIPWWQYSGGITYAPVDQSEGYWTISPLGYGVNGGSGNSSTYPFMNISDAAISVLRGVVDTGTTLILVDDSIASAYWSKVPSAVLDYSFFGGYIFNCNETLPDLKVLVGETGKATHTITVPGEYINYSPLSGGTCYGAIQPTFGQVPFNIYGDVLIKSAFLVFDRGKGGTDGARLGFADKAAGSAPA